MLPARGPRGELLCCSRSSLEETREATLVVTLVAQNVFSSFLMVLFRGDICLSDRYLFALICYS